MDVQFLTFEDVCKLHDVAISDFGKGLHGFLDEHCVRSATAQPQAGAFGEYFYRFPAGMAAAYLYFLTNQQGFLNGNKRTAVASALTFLARNGFALTVETFEVYRVTVQVAGEDVRGSREAKLSELERWIDGHLVPLIRE